MYETPELKKFGSFRELTRTGGWCGWAQNYPEFFDWLTGQGICTDDTPDHGGGMS